MAERTQTLTDDHSAADLLREMREKAEVERERMLKAAREEALAIEERSRRECERLEQEALVELEGELSLERDRAIGEVLAAARAERSAWRRTAMDSVFEAAEREIAERVGADGWDQALGRMLAEAIDFAGPGSTVLVSKEDLASCKRLLSAVDSAASVKGETDSRGRILAVSADGRRRAENSLGVRLERVKRFRSGEIAQILFGTR